jgi:DNA polymerase-3 subunit alpha
MNTNASFVHLHNHSDHSVLDGMCRIPDLVRKAHEQGMTAVALSDHANISGVLEFYLTAKKEGVKPILGCELYHVNDMKERNNRQVYHLILLAKNVVGYHNLIKISSAGYLQGLYYVPRVDLELLSKHSEGLIALTACVKGYIPSMILQGNMGEAKAELGRLKEIFKDDVYIEVMDHGLVEQKIVNPELIKLSSEFDIPIVATNDTHYISDDDHTAHDALLCIQTGKTLSDPDRLRFCSDQFYFKSTHEMMKIFPDQYLRRTLEVTEKCDLELDIRNNQIPQFLTPDGSHPDDYLWQKINEGIQNRFNGNLDVKRKERLIREYDIIKKMQLSTYFLIIADMIQYARQKGIRVGPGRGSCVASLITYSLGITDIDPIENNLLLERFLVEGRKNLPDIDVDFAHNRREEIIEYLRNKYGYVAQIATYNKLSPRSLVRDVGKVLGMNPKRIDEIAKAIPEYKTDLDEGEDKCLADLQSEVPELRNVDPLMIDLCTRLHNVIRHQGRHPAGIVVNDKPISVPLCRARGVELTQYDMNGVEYSKLLKIDVLGIKFLSVIDMALNLIEQRHGIRLDKLDMGDVKTYDLICAGDTSGVFQLGQKFIGSFVEVMQPRCFEDLVHLISIGRPGVVKCGLTDRYFQARASGKIQYLYPNLEHILKESYGILIFQEQVMQIAVEVAGLSWSESDDLRKAISKQRWDLMDGIKAKFIDGCASQSMPIELANALWEQIRVFGYFGFCKSHATVYAKVTYQTAYIKAHYPLEYLASLLSFKGNDNIDERKQYISEARKKGIKILSPDINISTDRCNIVGNSVCLPLTFIKGIGATAYNAISGERSKGAYKSITDFLERVDKRRVNKKVRGNLAKAGAFDNLYDRPSLLKRIFNASNEQLIAMEKDVLGLCISTGIIDESFYGNGTIHINAIAGLSLDDEFMTMGIVENVHEHIDRNGNTMAFITLADNTAQLEVVIFSDVYECPLAVGDVMFLTAKLSEYEPLKVIATSFDLLSGVTS